MTNEPVRSSRVSRLCLIALAGLIMGLMVSLVACGVTGEGRGRRVTTPTPPKESGTASRSTPTAIVVTQATPQPPSRSAGELGPIPPAPGNAKLGTVRVRPEKVSGAPYPTQPRMPKEAFDGKVNTPLWKVPTAPFVPGRPTETETKVTRIGRTGKTAAPPIAPEVVFRANNGLGLPSGGGNGTANTTAEPSGDVGGGVIFATANWIAAYSTDGGTTFTQLNPTTVFPADAVGFCCDQIVQYVPSIDRFIWLLQGNGYRLATASPADIINSNGTAWIYWNLTPNVFGAATAFDYPDLSVGDNQLYISWDAIVPGSNNSGFQVVRTSLAGIQAGGTISIQSTTPSDAPNAWGSHLMQNTGDEIFWAGHNSNSELRVFSLAENSNTYSWRDIGISSWSNNAPTSITPDGQDWLAKNFNWPSSGGSFPYNGVIGSTRAGDQLWFAWSAGTDENFPRAHVEMVALDRNNNFNLIQQVQIWNGSYAFAYPSLSTNACTGEVGLSFEYGGNGNYENHVVGFWGDYVAYQTTASDVGVNRFGDYVTIRQTVPTEKDPGNLFNAFGYGLNTATPPGTGTNVDVHYVLFGRPASSCNRK